MRIVAILLSVMVFTYLTYSLLVQKDITPKKESSLNASQLIVPAYISDEPLEVEKVWQQLKYDRLKSQEPKDKQTDSNKKNKGILTFGDKKYTLYGIFNGKEVNDTANAIKNKSQAFILIKVVNEKSSSDESQLLKIMYGEELLEGVFLTSVTNNSISFKQDNNLIEFKLFNIKK